MKRTVDKFQSTSKRKRLLESGAYDGRYRQKTIPNKKKKAQKNWARKNKN